MPKTTGALSPMLEASDEDGPGDRPAALRSPLRRSRAVHGRSRKVHGSVSRRARRKASRLSFEAHDAIVDGAIFGAVIGAFGGGILSVLKGLSSLPWWPLLVVVGVACGVTAEVIDLATTARARRKQRPVVLEPRISHVNRCTDHR